MAFALRLGLSPEAFWRLSLAEWRALTRPWRVLEPLSRAGFDALCARHPDTLRSQEETL